MSCACFRAFRLALAAGVGVCGLIAPAWSAETQSTALSRKTQLVIKLAADEVPAVRSRFQDAPPAIIVEFPAGRVAGMLPERSKVQRGVVEEIQTVYASSTKPGQRRWVQALKIILRGPYKYQLTPERGRILIDIEHPDSVGRENLELGLPGGAIIAGAMPPALSERFLAMQEALNRARPQPWIWRAGAAPEAGLAPKPAGLIGQPLPRSTQARSASTAGSSSPPSSSRTPRGRADALTIWMWVLGGMGLAGFAGTGWLWRRQVKRAVPQARTLYTSVPRVPSGIRVIDQLVWRAFERQGYQLVHMVELGEPLGLMRVMVKDGLKAALLCVGDGVFFEKTTVEQFVQSMRKAHMEQGFLIAPGSFTVPAQHCAKEHGVTLIAREQLTQLLSDGAVSEYYTKQIQRLHKQLEDAQETLNEYARQLDAIRKQRNEASWFLGEERAKTAQLDSGVNELARQLAEAQAQASHWQETAQASHKQWEESQWYLGEAQTAARHLDDQLRGLHEAHGALDERARALTQQLQAMEQQRDQANWYLGEARAALEERERRRAPRSYRPAITIDVDRPDGSSLFQGIPRNISRSGFAFPTDQPFQEVPDHLRIRLHLPGSAPINATGRVVWQRQETTDRLHPTGCEFLDIPAQARNRFEELLATSG
ncbi:MAG: PilZ domain-containing protein [Candidatus Omnitrophica bacterium]|nr:PilZ domain-containing protein [Candidatus Omnitrophota bacterium]